MFVDPLREHKGFDLGRVVKVQLNAWCYESHCWVQQADGTLKCDWCGDVHFGTGYSPSVEYSDKELSLCHGNPVLKKFFTV